MRVSLIAALTTNNVIGRDNGLPWRLSTDLKRFKALTTGHYMIMGRRTYDSVGCPLPGRTNVVITRDSEWSASGVLVVHTLDAALELAKDDPEPFIAGGAEIFRLALPRADRMYLTRIHVELEGDTFFPEFDDVREWRLVDSEHFEADEKNEYPFSFLTYDRVVSAEDGRIVCETE